MKRYILTDLILSCIFLFFISCYQTEKTVIKVAFYNVKKEARQLIESGLKSRVENENSSEIDVQFEVVMQASSLTEMVENKRVDLIFSTTRALPFGDAYIERFNNTYYQDLPDFIKVYSVDVFNYENNSCSTCIKAKSVDISKNNYFLCPLLIEPYCLAVHTGIAKDMEIKQTKKYTGEDFEVALEMCKNRYSLMLSAGDDDTLNFFLSFVMKMIYVSDVRKTKYTQLKDMQQEIKNTLNTILRWQKKGYFHSEWFRLKKEDVNMFMEIEDAGIVFIKQSEYESLPKNIKDSYVLVQFPTTTSFSQNYQPCSVLSIAKTTPISQGKSELIDKVIGYCLTQDWQQEMEGATGYISLFSFIEKKESPYSVHGCVLDDASTLLLESVDQSPSFIKEIRYYFSIAGLGY